MNILEIVQRDKSVRESIARFYKDPNHKIIALALLQHAPKAQGDAETSHSRANGFNEGIRHVFNIFEEIATTQPDQAPKLKSYSGPDPDLAT